MILKLGVGVVVCHAVVITFGHVPTTAWMTCEEKPVLLTGWNEGLRLAGIVCYSLTPTSVVTSERPSIRLSTHFVNQLFSKSCKGLQG